MVNDVNGDGFDDLLIGASENDDNGIHAGQAYLVFGRDAGWQFDLDLDQADASFLGEANRDGAGSVVAEAGDVNADGLGDVLIAAFGNDEGGTTAGQVYLVLGRNTGWQMGALLEHSDASFLGDEDYAYLQYCSGGGDVDGDGFSDFVIASPYNSEAGQGAGVVYLLLGRPTGWTLDSNLSMAEGSFLGENPYDFAGLNVAAGGDVNGDGLDDILIGAYGNSEAGLYAGKAYLVFGDVTISGTNLNLGDSEGSFVGEMAVQTIGNPIAVIDDMNGDGYDDLLFGASSDDEAGSNAGQAYLVYGKAAGWAPSTSLAYADASFHGESPGDFAGSHVGGAGDVNGDGFGDFLIAASWNSDTYTEAGKAYLLLGGASGWAMDTPLSLADGMMWGEASDDLFGRMAGGGDTNGDGYDDFIIGSLFNCENGDEAGQSYLYHGNCWDQDLDGSMACEGDCDDTDPTVYPGAPELCDGVDNDCDPTTDEDDDLDGDGYRLCEDCDDDDALVNPDAEEACNSLDDDCDPATDENLDSDGDGFSLCDGDCDDTDTNVYPGAPELCDGLDNDCDGTVDDDTDVDLDGDGTTACEGDCQPLDDQTHPGAEELCDGFDNDCDGVVPQDETDDLDFDGWTVCEGDCDDGNTFVFPGADDDNCDGEDSDCDGEISTDEQDQDGDTWLPCEGDCDDGDSTIHPEAEEACDGADNDCDGAVDEDCVQDDDDSAPQLDDDDDDDPTDCECRITGQAALEPRRAVFLALFLVALARRRRRRQTPLRG